MQGPVYSFGLFKLDPSARTLLKAGQPVKIHARSFDLLKFLVEHANRVASKEQLLGEIWKDVHVSDNSVDKQISLIRKILGDGSDGRPYIETIPGEGYRFRPVSIFDSGSQGRRIGPRFRIGAILAASVLSGVAIWAYSNHKKSGGMPYQSFGRKSIAVLDFRNVTGSPDVEWLSTALGEMLAADLTASGRFQAVPGAEVSRALSEISFKANTPPAPAQIERIAKRVGADRVVIGRYSVSRDQFRVDAELLSGRSDEVIAAVSETGTQDDLFQVVSRVGRELAEKLQDRELSETEVARLKASFPEDSRARQDYYQGLARLRAGNAVAAAHFLEEAVSRDPGFPLAHSALAEALAILGYETKAIEEAKRASETAAALPRDQVLASEGQYYTVNRDWLRAVKVYGALNSLWPDDFDYLLKLANAEAKQGREKEAYEAINQLRKLSVSPDDPRPDLAEASVADIFADYNRENRVAGIAEAKARHRSETVQAARAELKESWALDNLGQLSQAVTKANEAKAIFSSFGDRGNEARAWKNLGDAYFDQSKLDLSVHAYGNAISTFRALEWQSGVAVGLNNLAYAIKDQGDLSKAGQLFGESLTIARSLGDPRLEALALNGVAIILSRQSNLTGAQAAYEESVKIHERLGDKGRLAIVVNNLALIFQNQGNLVEAELRLQRALSLFQETGRQADVAMALGNLGQLCLLQGKLPDAEYKFRKQVEGGQQLDQPKQTGYGLFGLGEVAFLRCNLNQAHDYFEQSLRVREQTHQMGTAAESRLALARVELEEQHPDLVQKFASQAKDEFDRERQVDLVALSDAVLARAFVAQKKDDEAMGSAEIAEKLSNTSEDHDNQTQTALEVGRAFMQMDRRTEAVKEFRFALSESEHYHYATYYLEARIALARLDLQSGDPAARIDLKRGSAAAKKMGILLIANEAAEPDLALARPK